jgi:very-short-patch-repair endonuclease
MSKRHPVSAHRRSVLEARAREMRHAPTRSEAVLWSALKCRQLGVVFRRQVVIGNSIADFAAPESRLVVEVDGGSHQGRERDDARRDLALGRAGYRVVRVSAELVLRDLLGAVDRVRMGFRRSERTPE